VDGADAERWGEATKFAALICRAYAPTAAGPILLDWEQVKLDWHWRLSGILSTLARIGHWPFPKSGSQRDAGPAMGWADSTVGRDAGKRLRLSISR